jgi:acyl-coenzyme A thioesterase PaaI-like protein
VIQVKESWSNDEISFASFHVRENEMTDIELAHVDLAQVMRKVMNTAFTSRATVAEVRQAISLLNDAVGVLHVNRGADAYSPNIGFFMDRSPMFGSMNPIAVPMDISQSEISTEESLTGIVVQGSIYFTELFEGPPGHVHGGFVAAAFDEVLGVAQSMSENPGMTGKLTISYRSPTPLFQQLTLRGYVRKVEGRKIFTYGTLHKGDTLCAEAEGLFISMNPEVFERLMQARSDIAARD